MSADLRRQLAAALRLPPRLVAEVHYKCHGQAIAADWLRLPPRLVAEVHWSDKLLARAADMLRLPPRLVAEVHRPGGDMVGQDSRVETPTSARGRGALPKDVVSIVKASG